jgi:parallel beta-helix repeat protein
LPTISAKQWWFDYAHHTIYFHDNPSGHTVETSVLDTAFDSSANNVTIQYLTIKGFANPIQRAGIEATSGNANQTSSLNWVIRNCEAYNNHGAGVRIAFGMQIYNSYLHDNGALGVSGGTNSSAPSGIIIQGNTVSHNNYARVLSGSGAGGLKFGNTAKVVVRGNIVNNNDGAGIHFDASCMDPLVDGNVVTGNTGGAGIAYEISVSTATIRNNIVLKNALPDLVPISTAGIGSYASTGVNAYCNVLEIPNTGVGGAHGITIGATQRGNNVHSPFEYLMSIGNQFHYNTVIWDTGASGLVGYFQLDALHQPAFFALNSPPDHNEYHLSSLSNTNFVYDNNNTQKNTKKTFTAFQASGADIHGSADTNNKSGFPTVAITSPLDQSSFSSSVTVAATAADKSGINRVEFYVDWNYKATVSSSPFKYNFASGLLGTHTVTAMAYSNAGIRSCYAVTLTKK